MPEFPRYPEIQVKLSGTSGNVFAALGRVREALRQAGVDDAEVSEFVAEATAPGGTYENALQTAMRWVDVS